jgi:DNA-binding PucR family transcriptional regulator
MGNYEDHFILILFDATDAEISLPLAKILFSDSIQDLGLDQDTIIGIGNLVDADQLSFSNTHALNAQFWAKKASRSIVIFEEMSILRFLDSENGYQDAMILLDKYIIPLQDYDQQNNAELIATLQAYITSLWNYSETSRVMYIHCNTVKYRISQIKETLGIDWSDVQERINLEMAIMVHDFLNSEQINQQ